jgi:histidinol phosphatase-like enzyme
LEVALSGEDIERVYYGPHHVEQECRCRQPRTGLLWLAQMERCGVPETPFFEGDSPKDRAALDAVGYRTMLIRRTSFLKTPCFRNQYDPVVTNQYEAGGTGLMAEMTKAGQAVMEIVRA